MVVILGGSLMMLLLLLMVVVRLLVLGRWLVRRARRLPQHHGFEVAIVFGILVAAELALCLLMASLMAVVVCPRRAHLAFVPLPGCHRLHVRTKHLLMVPVVDKLHHASVAVGRHLVHHRPVELSVLPVLCQHLLPRGHAPLLRRPRRCLLEVALAGRRRSRVLHGLGARCCRPPTIAAVALGRSQGRVPGSGRSQGGIPGGRTAAICLVIGP
uniref:Putative secreted protein n=1 Tax=Ixodes ricinus TaxID=34613 RepID=A0A6B0V247_IXORI